MKAACAPCRFLQRWRIILTDRLRLSVGLRRLLFFWKFRVRIRLNPATDRERVGIIDALCQCARLAVDERDVIEVEEAIDRVRGNPEAVAAVLAEGGDPEIRKSLIIKPYNEATGERGAVFISFEYQWQKLLSMRNRAEFARRYDIVVSPTWTPPHTVLNCTFAHLWPEPVFTLISNLSDIRTFPRLCPNYRVVELFASSWVNPDLFTPRLWEERDIDLVMLANFGIYKRHHVLFRAMRDLPRDWKVVLVGQPNGSRTARVLLDEAAAFGVRDRVQLRERVSDGEVCELLCRARMSLICSKREGSCVAVVESMFADTPVGLLSGAGIGSGAFVNENTGAFLEERHLARELAALHARAPAMQPRRWSLDHGIDARSSSRKLSEALARAASERGRPWTRDLLPFHWRPDPMPLDPAESAWIGGERARLRELTGMNFGAEG